MTPTRGNHQFTEGEKVVLEEMRANASDLEDLDFDEDDEDDDSDCRRRRNTDSKYVFLVHSWPKNLK